MAQFARKTFTIADGEIIFSPQDENPSRSTAHNPHNFIDIGTTTLPTAGTFTAYVETVPNGGFRSIFDAAGVDNLDETPIEINEGIVDEKGTPAWYTLNLKSSYQLNDNLNIQAGIDNVLDQHYKTAGSGLSAPGRNLILSVRAKF